jgi:hypothetical protein
MWLVPHHRPNSLGVIAYVVLLMSLFIAAWVPDIPGKLRKIHRLTAYGAVMAMPLVLAALLTSIQTPLYVQFIITAVIMAHLVMIYLLFFVPAAYRHFLVFQAVYLAGFFIAMLGVTYG